MGGGVVCTMACERPSIVCTSVEHEIPMPGFDAEEIDDADIGARIGSVQQACTRLTEDARASAPAPEALFDEAAAFLVPDANAPEIAPEALLAHLLRSRMIAAYLDHAQEHGVSLEPSAQATAARYDREAGTIFYNPRAALGPLLLAIAGELRRHWQDRAGALVPPLAFAPETALLVGRAQAADIAQATLRAAWDWRLAGVKAPWIHVEAGALADLGQAYAAEALLDFRGLASGDAALAVFEAWFLSPRCAAMDRTLIHRMLAGLSAPYQGLREVVDLAAPQLLAALGTRPIGENYLAPHAGSLLDDPLFTEVRDRANANFLWFVKFEDCLRRSEEPQLQREFRAAALAEARKDPLARLAESLAEGRDPGTPYEGAEVVAFRPAPRALTPGPRPDGRDAEVIRLFAGDT